MGNSSSVAQIIALCEEYVKLTAIRVRLFASPLRLIYNKVVIIDLSSLEQAVDRLGEILERYGKEAQDLAVQDSVVQRFEYTYELAYKTLKRFLEMTSANPAEIDVMSFQELIRTGNEKGLLKSRADTWLSYRDKRNMTSHTYDSTKAGEVISIAPKFYEEAKHLLERIKERNA